MFLLLVIGASAANCIAQDKPDAPTPKQSDTPPSAEKAQVPQGSGKNDKNTDAQGKDGQGQTSGTSNDRLFFTLPNFLTLENANQVPPLTAGQTV
jgi:hypothetical protein